MFSFSSRHWAGLSLAAALVPAGVQAQDIPRQSPNACKGQAELRPLQPLQVVTPKGRTALQVEFADSPVERQYGLMCRRSLAPDRGMLFDFQRPQFLAFWMRNTLIPLDIVYIGADGRVVSVVANARPLDETPLPSNGPARAVLELAGGRAAQLGLLPGDRIVHRIFSQRR
ncbi:DUF192 domain-containing protein [Phenylobacterium sp.]|uniref:DUF192 domain-containing protein n=1 Tax=Phenylobacterium sp. TaxID=1871053 RepID=UPI0037832FBB